MISSGITALLFDLLKILIGNTSHEYFYVTEIFVANFAFFYIISYFFILINYGKTSTRPPHIVLGLETTERDADS